MRVGRVTAAPGLIAAYLAAEQQLGRVKAAVDTSRVSIILLTVLFGIGMLPTAEDGSVDRELIDTAVGALIDGIGADPI